MAVILYDDPFTLDWLDWDRYNTAILCGCVLRIANLPRIVTKSDLERMICSATQCNEIRSVWELNQGPRPWQGPYHGGWCDAIFPNHRMAQKGLAALKATTLWTSPPWINFAVPGNAIRSIETATRFPGSTRQLHVYLSEGSDLATRYNVYPNSFQSTSQFIFVSVSTPLKMMEIWKPLASVTNAPETTCAYHLRWFNTIYSSRKQRPPSNHIILSMTPEMDEGLIHLVADPSLETPSSWRSSGARFANFDILVRFILGPWEIEMPHI